MVTRFYDWAGPYLQDKVYHVADPFDLDDMSAILDVMKAHQPNVMLKLQPTISASPNQILAINATLTDEHGFILALEDVQRLRQSAQGSHRAAARQGSSNQGSSPQQGSSNRVPISQRGSSAERQNTAQSAASPSLTGTGKKPTAPPGNPNLAQGRKEDYTKAGFRRDDRQSRLPFKENKGNGNYQQRPAARIQQGKIRTRCQWCHGARHKVDKCVNYYKVMEKKLVPPQYVC
jgi:hypothetical protein